MKNEDISIVVPALNESLAIVDVIRGLRTAFSGAELIVVDDGSSDATATLAAGAGARVIRHESTCGYGAAIKTGALAAARDYLVFCDADGQHSSVDVKRVVDACDGCDMVVGFRDKRSHFSRRRMAGKFILHHFANFLLGEKVPDFNSGLRIIKKSILLKYMHLLPRGFSFTTTTTFAFLKSGRCVRWVPIQVRKRQGKSSVRQIVHGPQVLLLMMRLTVLFEPLKIFLSVAGILFVLSVVSLAVHLTITSRTSIGNTTVVLFLSALLVFMFGLLCDQVSAVRREMHE